MIPKIVLFLIFVPPIVVIPPHNWRDLGWRQWWAYIPPVESLRPETAGDRLAKFPKETFEALHELDEEVCVGGPAQAAEYPNVNRCEGLI